VSEEALTAGLVAPLASILNEVVACSLAAALAFLDDKGKAEK
jgi:hypothetical protein